VQPEIEVKFANVDHDVLRHKLTAVGAKLEQPMRLMRRVVIRTPAMEADHAFLRVRDEGDKVTMTYKQTLVKSIDGTREIEIVVDNFKCARELLQALFGADATENSYQETKRETWRLDEAEIVLDVWPWLNPYIEIEAPTTTAVKRAADKLGFDMSESSPSAHHGSVTTLYRLQYPHMTGSLGDLPVIRFEDPVPAMLKGK
jgi:adenylate cyclase class 2